MGLRWDPSGNVVVLLHCLVMFCVSDCRDSFDRSSLTHNHAKIRIAALRAITACLWCGVAWQLRGGSG